MEAGKTEPSGIREREWYTKMLRTTDNLVWTNAADDRTKLVVSHKILNAYGDVYGIVYLLLNYNGVFMESFEHPLKGPENCILLTTTNELLHPRSPLKLAAGYPHPP